MFFCPVPYGNEDLEEEDEGNDDDLRCLAQPGQEKHHGKKGYLRYRVEEVARGGQNLIEGFEPSHRYAEGKGYESRRSESGPDAYEAFRRMRRECLRGEPCEQGDDREGRGKESLPYTEGNDPPHEENEPQSPQKGKKAMGCRANRIFF
jgi:hypothetical protein